MLIHKFVEYIPDVLEPGVLYISIEYTTAVHKCCCGCGFEVVTPLSPMDWRLIFDGKSVSLEPSIGNWSYACQSHYWITRNQVRWAETWSTKRINAARRYHSELRTEHASEGTGSEEEKAHAAKPDETSSKEGLWTKLKSKLKAPKKKSRKKIKEAMVLVFQYGSNMSLDRLNGPKRLQGNARCVGIAETVENYEYVFDIPSKGNECAAADLLPGTGRRIWGVLYEIPMTLIERDPEDKRTTLDKLEAEGINYSRSTISLRYKNGKPVRDPVFTYLGLDRRPNIKTSAEYVGFILQGLAEHPDIPAEYVHYVRARALANDPSMQLP